MSFGFSIGDIILLSQLAYDLYATVSSGRKAASRDLKELEEVLFSLKCALDHLRDVSTEVLERPGMRHGESGLKEKLDVMIGSCAATLQELDAVTKKYRVIESQASKRKATMSSLDDVKKSIRVNWQRVRWDREKQSLQQYREKLKVQEAEMNARHDVDSSEVFSIAAYSWSDSVFGESYGPNAESVGSAPSVSLHATSDLPRRTHNRRAVDSISNQPSTSLEDHIKLPTATVALNNERRAFGAKEFEAFKQQHTRPNEVPKPSLLKSVAPTSQDLQACIPHIFRSTAEGKQQTQELKNEMTRWTHEFSRFVNDGNATQKSRDESVLTLLGVLNEAIDSSSGKMRQLFYETSDSAGFTSVLNQVETMSKSVRVMKEIEEFQDAKEEWSEQTVR
ncbi:uncharacterized protein J4E79_006642 [Alternaria viburni]|uniref:uncharacterized protein n=1 Tax=Alternaria viburni TaxID=566460 RepID=UPI0020C26F60|nr:uncharacterized protein J4E79_006642 [Alternaria viburni]KAI4658882.1 hypothetical protein J4E79_006642 [Alternaria viburni]